jgi:geranylgeranyl transferase type-1 subunit beta
MMVIEDTSSLENASDEAAHPLPTLVRHGHAAHCMRCITGLPESQVEVDASRWVA